MASKPCRVTHIYRPCRAPSPQNDVLTSQQQVIASSYCITYNLPTTLSPYHQHTWSRRWVRSQRSSISSCAAAVVVVVWWPEGDYAPPFLSSISLRWQMLTSQVGQLGPQSQGSLDRGRGEQLEQPMGLPTGHLPQEHEAGLENRFVLRIPPVAMARWTKGRRSLRAYSRGWIVHQLLGKNPLATIFGGRGCRCLTFGI